MKNEPEFYTIDEFAALFRRVPATVRTWCIENVIESRRVGKVFLIPRAAVDRARREGVILLPPESSSR
jgi:excisionase family DNA binding protein